MIYEMRVKFLLNFASEDLFGHMLFFMFIFKLNYISTSSFPELLASISSACILFLQLLLPEAFWAWWCGPALETHAQTQRKDMQKSEMLSCIW